MPRGFAQMAFPDLHDFNRQTYSFEFVRREFLGEVRCLVFDVAPLRKRLRPFRGPHLGGRRREFHRSVQRHLLDSDSFPARAGGLATFISIAGA